jgi:predicted transcriptional regulator
METVTRLCKRVLKVVREYFSKLKTIDELNKFQIHINNTIKIVNKAIKNKLHKNNVFCSTLSEFENFLLCERILINVTTCLNETSS